MGRRPKQNPTLKSGVLYSLDGRHTTFTCFKQVVSRQLSKNLKLAKELSCRKWNLFTLGEQTFFGREYVQVLALSKDSEMQLLGFVRKGEFLTVVAGTPQFVKASS